jgi:hypothetical protein
MAVSASSKQSFAVIGVPSIVKEIDLNENGTDPKRALGFKVEDAQGNVYRWCHFGATTAQGLLCSTDLSESGVVDTDDAVTAPANCVVTTYNTIAQKYVQLTIASVTANQYAGGQFITTDDTGEGYTYNIVGNDATGTAASGQVILELERPLAVALDNTTDWAIMGSRYGNLEPATTTDINVVGVSMASNAAGDYGWVMTKGQAGVLDQGTTTIGTSVMIGSVAGSVTDMLTTTVLAPVGMCVVAGDNTGYAGVRFNLE